MLDESPVKRAMDQLTLADVWELAPDNSEAPRRDGLRKSPFHEDRKPSFSIFGGLTRYKDQSSDDKAGGVWTFVQACRPEWSKSDVAKYLVERAGLPWDQDQRKQSKRLWKEEQARQRKQTVERIYREASKSPERPAQMDPWPGFVMEAYSSRHAGDEERMESLAQRRGWPVEWVEWLYAANFVKFPALPWNDKHYPALPVCKTNGIAIGYHQRIWTEADGPAWLFVPYAPRVAVNAYTKRLQEYAAGRPEGRLVQPLPFVLGPVSSSLWIITEGQWDAITVYGLLGGFEDQFDLSIAVFGLRGAASGPSIFLANYQDALRRYQPEIWLMRDNDGAGKDWDSTRGRLTNYARPEAEAFDRQLFKFLPQDRRIRVTKVPQKYGKDFNDFYKLAKPTRQSFIGTLTRLFPSWIQKQIP